MFLGNVETDETYIGGKHHGKRGRGSENKTIVFGLVERNGRAKAVVVPDASFERMLRSNTDFKTASLGLSDTPPGYKFYSRTAC